MNDLPCLSFIVALTFFYIGLAWYFLDSLRLITWAAIYSFGLVIFWSESHARTRLRIKREVAVQTEGHPHHLQSEP